MEDIVHVPDDLALLKEGSNQPSEHIRLSSVQDNQMSQQMESPKLNNSSDVEILSFDKYQVALPKGDLKKEWNKLKQYMDIKLEDYVYDIELKKSSDKIYDDLDKIQEEKQNSIKSSKIDSTTI